MIKRINVIGDLWVTPFSKDCLFNPICIDDISISDLYSVLPESYECIPAIFDVIRDIPRDEHIMLSVGNLDCITCLWKDVSPGVMLEEYVQRAMVPFVDTYVSFLRTLVDNGYHNLIVLGPGATAFPMIEGYAVTQHARNYGILRFSELLELGCRDLGIPFISTYFNTIRNDFSADPSYYDDSLVFLRPEHQSRFTRQQLAYYYIFHS